jgi:hypothetical protein
MIDIVTGVGRGEWNKFLSESYDATIYHTPEWKNFIEETFGFEPHYLSARDEHGDIVGFLPLFHVKKRLTGSRLCSLPFSHDCGIIGDPRTYESLVFEAIGLMGRVKASHIEIRNKVDTCGFKPRNSFSTYILRLSPSVKDVEKRVHERVMRGVKKSLKSDISVYVANDEAHLKKFYEINCGSKKKLGVVCHPWKYIKNLFKCLDGRVSLYVVESGGKMISGGIMEYYQDRVTYAYGATDDNYVKLDPSKAFLWNSIVDACGKGYRYYDFGRASYDNIGLIYFKQGWGTEEKRLYYSYYPEVRKSLVSNRNNIKFRLGSMMARNMPTIAYKRFSDAVIGDFG